MTQKLDYEPYLKEIEGLFPRPRIMAQVTAKLRKEDSSFEEIAELLLTDTTMVASLVQMSNSSYFGFAEKAESLEEAMQRVGLAEIARMVSVSVANQVYRRELARYRTPPVVFWESCLSAALLMEALAQGAGRDAGEAYLAGLMREIGMLVIDHALTVQGSSVSWDCYQPVQVWEGSVCGCDHTETGGRLLESWGFPASVCDAVREQWSEAEAKTDLGARLRLTNAALARAGCDFSVPVEDWAGLGALAERCSLSVDTLPGLVTAAAGKFARLRAMAS